MDKELFFKRLLESLEQALAGALEASHDAADYAVNEESRAESKWDTQGLEASYLAAGQADQARQCAEVISGLKAQQSELLKEKKCICPGALFLCQINGSDEYFFYAAVAGGHTVRMGRSEITVISPQSPLAGRLLGLKKGDDFRMPNGHPGKLIHVC